MPWRNVFVMFPSRCPRCVKLVTLRGGSVAVDFFKSRLTGKKAGVERNPDFLNKKKQGNFFSPVEMN